MSSGTVVQSVPSGLQFCWITAAVFRPACLRTALLPTHPSPATPPPRPASGECGHSRHPSLHRRLWLAWENHPGLLHTPSEPLNHLRNQDRTFAGTSWFTSWEMCGQTFCQSSCFSVACSVCLGISMFSAHSPPRPEALTNTRSRLIPVTEPCINQKKHQTDTGGRVETEITWN
jgi:hypothetical protein